MKNIKQVFGVLTTLICLISCTDFLDLSPVNKLSPGDFFKSETDLELYTNSFYQTMLPGGLTVVNRDEMGDFTSKNSSPTFIAGAYSSVNEGKWNWSNIRNLNYFIAKASSSPVEETHKRHYIGVARLFRAKEYFDKVVTYGDVPWYSEPIDPDDEDQLMRPRDPRALVIDSIMADLDYAVANLHDVKDESATTITKQVALGLKSRICLFEGTYRKYHHELGLEESSEHFLEEAARAAKQVMDTGKYRLYSTGHPDTDYRTLFISEKPVSEEILFAVEYNNALRRWHNITWKYNSATYGARWGLNKQFVNTYLMKDGTRFTDRPDYDRILFVDEMKDRDPRLSQTIRSLGYKRSDGTPAPPNFGYTFTGYHILKFSLDDKRLDGVGESYNSVTLLRYGEILLNYAEAMAELGKFDQSTWELTIAPLRERAGVSPKIPDSADPYMQEVYFPEISDKYLLEIRRERGIELCYEGLRYRDLLRWHKGDLLEMPWKGIYVPAMDTPMDLDGNGTPDVSFVRKAPTKKTPGVIYYVIDGTSAVLSEGDKGHVLWRNEEKRVFSEKKYLHPISEEDLVLNPNLKQNPGWK